MSFIFKLGKDVFGDYIIDVLNEVNVNIDYVLRISKVNIGFVFVLLKEDGNCDFLFYRNLSVDMFLEVDEVKKEWFNNCYILYFCLVDLIDSLMKLVYKKVIEYVFESNSIISFDFNIRLFLWDSE